jgi:hypothetical protein
MRDRMTDEQIVEVVQARLAGKRIQWRYLDEDHWFPLPKQYEWNFFTCEFRVEPKTIYVNEYANGWHAAYDDRETAVRSADKAVAVRVAVPYREVVEEAS